MATETLSPYRSGVYAVALLLVVLLLALHFLSGALLQSEELNRWFIPLLVFIVAGLIILAGVVGWHLIRLLGEYRRKAAGAFLMARVLTLFVVLALAPVGMVYYYSLQFLTKGVDSWLDVEIDTAMADALELSQATLTLNQRVLLRFTEQMLDSIVDNSQAALALAVSELRLKSGATEIALVDGKGRVLAASHINPEIIVPAEPDGGTVQQVVSGENYVGLMNYGDSSELYIRCLVGDASRGLILQAIYPTSERIGELSNKVQTAFVAYKERAYLQGAIKSIFIMALTLVLAAAIFAAAWAAFFTVRRLIEPITNIAEGTLAISKGEYGGQIPVPKYKDELGFLVNSFNSMTRNIRQARDAAERSKQQLESQRKYLATVLNHLSTGVMALDADGHIRTANKASDFILRAQVRGCIGHSVEDLKEQDMHLRPFVDELKSSLQSPEREWRAEVELNRPEGRQALLCGRTRLDLSEGSDIGCVVVFDDVTNLVKAQRDAAWGEVARRLAHEIKNPLTPIQLSAERLRRKYLDKLVAEDRQVLDSATKTIVNQVDAMKSMVNAFSDYAKPSNLQQEDIGLDKFLAEVLLLYANSVTFLPGAEGLSVKADPVRLRQVVHNLVKNAQEATHEQSEPRIEILTRPLQMGGDESIFIELRIEDNGIGFPDESIGQLFEPYVTTKQKGTGLGLAIVKKIVEEHGGSITAENLPQGGACMSIHLPAVLDNKQKII